MITTYLALPFATQLALLFITWWAAIIAGWAGSYLFRRLFS